MDLKQLLKALRLNESTVSVVLGALVVLVIGIAATRWFAGNKGGNITQQAASEVATPSPIPEPVAGQKPNIEPGTVYTVQAGDSLWTISQKFYNGSGYNYVDIIQANKLANPGLIHPGNKLQIPVVPVRMPTKTIAQTAAPTPTVTGNSYTVVRGDSLWKIAVAAYGDGYKWTTIYNANKAKIGANPGTIFAGTQLSIPR